MFHRLSPYGQAVIMALTAYFLFSIADVSAKILSHENPLALCIFLPALIALAGMTIRILAQRGLKGFTTPHLKLHLIRAMVITGMVTLCVNALKLIPIADFYCIIFLSPFVVMTLSIIHYKEQIHWQRILVLILSFIGVLITIGPRFHELNIGYLFVVCSVLFSSANIIVVRKIGRDEYIPLYGFFPLLVIVLFTAPFALSDLSLSAPPQNLGLFVFYGLALIGAHSLLPAAFARTPMVSRLTPLHYSQMVWGILAGHYVFDKPWEMTTLLGGGLIVLSGMGLFAYEVLSSKNQFK